MIRSVRRYHPWGDLVQISLQSDFPQIIFEQPTDLVICEGAHFPVMEYLPVFEKSTVRRYCITHYVTGYFPDMLELKKALPGREVIFATDDMSLEV